MEQTIRAWHTVSTGGPLQFDELQELPNDQDAQTYVYFEIFDGDKCVDVFTSHELADGTKG